MIAEMMPSTTSTFAGWRSPWIQTGGRVHGVAPDARSQAARTDGPSISDASSVTRSSKVSTRSPSDTPRNGLRGALGGAGWCSARRNAPSCSATAVGTMAVARSAGVPSIHRTIDHDHGYLPDGRPIRIGTGTGNVRIGLSSGSHCCSLVVRLAATARRGRRASRSSPIRQSVLSHPASNSSKARPARSGC